MHRLFVPFGEIFFKTDHLEYFQSTVELIGNSPNFEIIDFTSDLHQSPFAEYNIKTEFELLFQSKGNPPIGFLRAKHIPEWSMEGFDFPESTLSNENVEFEVEIQKHAFDSSRLPSSVQ